MPKREVLIMLTRLALVSSFIFVAAQASAPQPGPNQGQVTMMRLAANPGNYNGTCPTTIKFGGFITVAGGPNTISYGVTRSDGGRGNGGSHIFKSPGTWRSTELTSWSLGAPGKTFNGWVEIGSGNVRSNRAAFHIHCSK